MRFPCRYRRFMAVIGTALYTVYLLATTPGTLPAKIPPIRLTYDFIDPRLSNQSDMAIQMLAAWTIQRRPNMNMDYKRAQMNLRKTLVQKVCHTLRKSKEDSFKHEHLFIDIHHKLSWCPVFKAASSSWFYNFVRLGCDMHRACNTTDSPFELDVVDDLLRKLGRFQKGAGIAGKARALFPPLNRTEATAALPHTMSFFVVRHPFERILSAYRDKLEQFHGKQYFYFKYGARIVSTYRNRTKNQTQENTHSITEADLPTFPEFIDFVLESNITDEHWTPFQAQCGVCSVSYDVVMRFESLYEDQWYLINYLKLDKKLRPRWRNANRRGLTSTHVASRYFSQISQDKIKRLHHMYQADFLMFGYDPELYIKMGFK